MRSSISEGPCPARKASRAGQAVRKNATSSCCEPWIAATAASTVSGVTSTRFWALAEACNSQKVNFQSLVSSHCVCSVAKLKQYPASCRSFLCVTAECRHISQIQHVMLFF